MTAEQLFSWTETAYVPVVGLDISLLIITQRVTGVTSKLQLVIGIVLYSQSRKNVAQPICATWPNGWREAAPPWT